MKLAAIMIQKNEVGLLPQWLAYYSELCGGNENLYVFDDHSTEPNILAVLREANATGVNVASCPQGSRGIDIKGQLVSEMIRSLGNRYDCYLPTDCDEFICVDSSKGGPNIEPQSVVSAITKTLSSTGKPLFRLDGCYVNIPGTTNVRRDHFKKIMVRSLPAGLTLDNGYHLYSYQRNMDTVGSNLLEPTNLLYIHCHYKPFSLVQQCSREKLQSYIPDFSRESLLAHKGDNFHVAKYLLMSESEYASRFASVPGIVPNLGVRRLLASVNAGWQRVG